MGTAAERLITPRCHFAKEISIVASGSCRAALLIHAVLVLGGRLRPVRPDPRGATVRQHLGHDGAARAHPLASDREAPTSERRRRECLTAVTTYCGARIPHTKPFCINFLCPLQQPALLVGCQRRSAISMVGIPVTEWNSESLTPSRKPENSTGI